MSRSFDVCVVWTVYHKVGSTTTSKVGFGGRHDEGGTGR